MKNLKDQAESKQSMRSVLEEVIKEMVAKGIYWPEAAAEFEKLFIMEALRRNRGNLGKAALTMGVHRNTLSKKMREFGIEKRSLRESAEKPPVITEAAVK
ncbi:MAG TPA: helix-turn-helix domain-containing protein [Acidobacteriota bacterium]|nr:helix-turn-helix domain-containing protein [Acidobacteriota bacterium]